jgi:YggT family protein
MVIVPQTGDRLGKQNPAYGLLQHTRIKPNAAPLLWSMAQRRPVKSDSDSGCCGRASMFVISNFLVAIAKILDIGLTLYMWVIIGRAIISWVNPDPYNPIVRFLNAVTEPVLYPIRRRLPLSLGGIDFSPIIVILAIIFIQSFVVQSLIQMAARMGG